MVVSGILKGSIMSHILFSLRTLPPGVWSGEMQPDIIKNWPSIKTLDHDSFHNFRENRAESDFGDFCSSSGFFDYFFSFKDIQCHIWTSEGSLNIK